MFHVLEKNVYSAAMYKMASIRRSIKSISVCQVHYFHIDFLTDLFIVKSGILKSPTMIALLPILPSDLFIV